MCWVSINCVNGQLSMCATDTPSSLACKSRVDKRQLMSAKWLRDINSAVKGQLIVLLMPDHIMLLGFFSPFFAIRCVDSCIFWRKKKKNHVIYHSFVYVFFLQHQKKKPVVKLPKYSAGNDWAEKKHRRNIQISLSSLMTTISSFFNYKQALIICIHFKSIRSLPLLRI